MLARHHDPIAAIATAPGRGAAGIVRVTGKGLGVMVEPHSSMMANLASAVSAPPEIKAPA